jgi:lactoylglutathione lyase
MMHYQFSYTRLLVNHFKECFVFYRDVLGFKPTFGTENDVYADFDTGAVTLALFNKKLMSDALGTSVLPDDVSVQDRVCLVFGVENVDAAWQALSQQGPQMLVGPADHPDWGMRSAYLRDPDGNLIELYQPLR